MAVRNFVTLTAAIAAMSLPAVALGQQAAVTDRPEVFRNLVQCRAIADNAERLACYDRQTAILDEAERKNEVMVVDRQQVKKAKKGLFGLSLPSIGNLFGKDDAGKPVEEDVDSIESTIKSARQNASGKWIVVIEDGARWVQVDTKSIFDPKPGQSIRIRRAALGSYMASINKQTAIRMRREN